MIEGLGQSGREFDRARSDGCIADAHPSRDAGVAICGVGRIAFIAHQDVPDQRGAGTDRIVERQGLPARQSKNGGYAVLDQHLNQQVAAMSHIWITILIAPPSRLRKASKASLICSNG